MTTAIAPIPAPVSLPAEPPRTRSFVAHAKLIGGLTLVSRFFGLGREVVAGHYLGTAVVGSAFTVAFVVPNLFRKLFGEGALSAAFIPLYAQAVKAEPERLEVRGQALEAGDGSPVSNVGPLSYSTSNPQPLTSANDFAAAAVNLLVAILVALTVVGEGVLVALLAVDHGFRPDRVLMLKLTAVMLPYVVLICGGAFLSGILQVHRRFGPPAAAPIILNACHIAVLLIGARMVGLSHATPAGLVEPKQTTLAYALAATVLVAGVMQVAVLLPALRAVGFRFKLVPRFWTPQVKRMLLLSLPVALGAGVLQLSVVLDKGISWFLMRADGVDTFRAFGRVIRLPLELGAPRHLDLAQFLYQFPLGIFAIALATAIFPGLSADAFDADRERFRAVLRQGIRASLWEGLPASLGLILVAGPATKLLFQHGEITAVDTALIARDAAIYAGAIWAFSLLQIINRAYYAVHDMTTPLVMSAVNLAINLAVEVPLLWWLGEAGMAVGTLVSFAVQAVVMLWMLDRKVGGLDLRRTLAPVPKMVLATAVMGVSCWAVERSPLYPHGIRRPAWAGQVVLLLTVGVAAYLGTCLAVGEHTLTEMLPRRFRK
jgi:putative peptidoglycan lipid II flippase